MAREAKISSDQRESQLRQADNMCKGQKEILRLISSKNNDFLDDLMTQCQDFKGGKTKNLIARLKRLIERQQGKEKKNKMPNTVVLHMILRFGYFVDGYINQVDKENNLSKVDQREAFRWSMIKYLEKQIKKEEAIKVTSKQIDIISIILVWGNRLLTSALSLLSSAPILFFSRCLGVHIKPFLCLWFYFSGLLTGLSTTSVKKQLSRICKNALVDKRVYEKQGLRKITIFRIFLTVLTSVSTCYFGLFGIRRLLKDPEKIGANVVINFLSKWLLPQIWPIIMPTWVLLTLISAMVNQYKDTKVFERLINHVKWKWDVRKQGKNQKKQNVSQLVKNGLLLGIFCTTALASSLSVFVTVIKLTSSMPLSIALSSCVWLMSFAKCAVLGEKIAKLQEKNEINMQFTKENTGSDELTRLANDLSKVKENPIEKRPETDLTKGDISQYLFEFQGKYQCHDLDCKFGNRYLIGQHQPRSLTLQCKPRSYSA